MVYITGLNGIGKTRFAQQYAHIHRENYSAVFWVNAATPRSIELSFLEISMQILDHYDGLAESYGYEALEYARLLGFERLRTEHPTGDELQAAVKAVHRWLALTNNDNWLLVCDSTGASYTEILELLPSTATGHGRVLLLAGDADLLANHTQDDVPFKTINLPPLSREDCIDLFCFHLGPNRVELIPDGKISVTPPKSYN